MVYGRLVYTGWFTIAFWLRGNIMAAITRKALGSVKRRRQKIPAKFGWARVFDRQRHPPKKEGGGFHKEVLEQLRASGSDMNRPHTFEFFLYLRTEPDAETAAQRLRESRFEAQVFPSGSGNGWLCRAGITLVPILSSLNEIGRFFEQLAAALEGEFDGWECAVVPEKRGRRPLPPPA